MVAIKDMEMPSCCYECEIHTDTSIGCFCPILQHHVIENKRHPDCPLAEIEPLTDEEKRIFLSSMGRERVICKQIDIDKVDDGSIKKLVPIVDNIERKVKKTLWK